MEPFRVKIEALKSMHRFGDILENAIESIQSEVAQYEVIRTAKDCIGRHWYGLRCKATCKRSGAGFYFHIGLIYLPTTRTGLMIELDEQNNKSIYAGVVEGVKPHASFEIERGEREYFKLFMPDATFLHMKGKARGEQLKELACFVQVGTESMIEAAYQTGFELLYEDLGNAFQMANAFDEALGKSQSDTTDVTIQYKDKDNFGQYAQGFRYDLEDKEKTVSLYAYFGAIYSYKKQPAGIFAEVDWFSNQEWFDRVYENIRPLDSYQCSLQEPKFVKLFMKPEQVERINKASYEEQIKELEQFIRACNDEMIRAAKTKK